MVNREEVVGAEALESHPNWLVWPGLEIEFTFLHSGKPILTDQGLIIALFCLVCHFLPFYILE